MVYYPQHAEAWTVNGLLMSTPAWDVKSWGDARQGTPPARGDNYVIPGVVGQLASMKIADSRTIPLSGWVDGMDPDTGKLPTIGAVAQFRKNWATLQAALWNFGRPYKVTKQVADPVAGTSRTVTATAELTGTLEPKMTGPARCEFEATLLLADPFFYWSTTVQFTIPATASPYGYGVGTVAIQGTAPTTRVTEVSRMTNNGYPVDSMSIRNDVASDELVIPPHPTTPGAAYTVALGPIDYGATLGTTNVPHLVYNTETVQWITLWPGPSRKYWAYRATNVAGQDLLCKYCPAYL